MSGQDQPERMTVLFAGHVQGVGFRYTTEHLARRFAVTGYVRNLPDGRVEVLAEGQANEVRAFIQAIEADLGAYIRQRTIQQGPPTGQFDGFTIRF